MYHVSRLGCYGPAQCADMEGYVPEASDGPWDLRYDHGPEPTHDAEGELTEYGEWWEAERWPELRAAAVEATQEAEEALIEWQQGGRVNS